MTFIQGSLFIFGISTVLFWASSKFRKIVYYFLSAFDGYSKGASANRISACAGIGIAIYATKRFTSIDNIVSVIVIWLSFVLLCLGIIVFKQIIELVNSYKNGNGGKTMLDDKMPLDEELKPTKSEIPNLSPDQQKTDNPPQNPIQ